jgi:hypothetical protein
MAAEIKTRITLDGVEAIQSKLKALGETGERALKQINAAGGSALGEGGKRAEEQLKSIGLHALEGEHGFRRVREAMHVLHPVLDAAGGRFAQLSAFMGASRAGAIGLAAALVGSLGVALQKIGVQSEETKKTLEALYWPQRAPEERAKALGIPTEDVVGFQSQIEHVRRLSGSAGGEFTFPESHVTPEGKVEPWKPAPGSEAEKIFSRSLQSPEGQADIADRLNKLLRLSGAPPDAAKKAEQEILAGFAKQAEAQPGVQPRLTAEMIELIRNVSPPGAQMLAQQFGWNSPEQLEGTLRQGGVATFPEFANKLSGIGAPLEKAFAERPRELSDRATAATSAAARAGEQMLSPPPEVAAAQHSAYERYQEARRLYASGGSGLVPGVEDPFQKGNFGEFSKAVSDFGRWVGELGQKILPLSVASRRWLRDRCRKASRRGPAVERARRRRLPPFLPRPRRLSRPRPFIATKMARYVLSNLARPRHRRRCLRAFLRGREAA